MKTERLQHNSVIKQILHGPKTVKHSSSYTKGVEKWFINTSFPFSVRKIHPGSGLGSVQF